MKKIIFTLLLILSFGVCSAETIVSGGGTVSSSKCPMGTASHKIVYNTNGGNEIEANYVSSMVPQDTSLPIPIKENYIFVGWFYDAALTEKVEVDSYREIPYTPAYDEKGCTKLVTTTLYASWQSKELTGSDKVCPVGGATFGIVYNTNGGNKIEDYVHCSGCEPKNVTLPTPKKKGYEFAGWYYDSKFKNKVDVKYANKIKYTQLYNEDGCMIYSPVNLYAKWKKEVISSSDSINSVNCPMGSATFKVIYNTNGGTEIKPYTHCSVCKPETDGLPIPEKEGYKFEGWYYDLGYIKKVDVNDVTKITYTQLYDKNGCIKLTEVNLYAKWSLIEVEKELEEVPEKKDKITVNFDTDGGDEVVSIDICDDCDSKTELDVPKKEGFKFAGWYYDKDYKKKVTEEYLEDIMNGLVLSENDEFTLYAKWEIDDTVKKDNKIIYILLIIIVVLLILVFVVNFIRKRKKKAKKENEIEVLGL